MLAVLLVVSLHSVLGYGSHRHEGQNEDRHGGGRSTGRGNPYAMCRQVPYQYFHF